MGFNILGYFNMDEGKPSDETVKPPAYISRGRGKRRDGNPPYEPMEYSDDQTQDFRKQKNGNTNSARPENTGAGGDNRSYKYDHRRQGPTENRQFPVYPKQNYDQQRPRGFYSGQGSFDGKNENKGRQFTSQMESQHSSGDGQNFRRGLGRDRHDQQNQRYASSSHRGVVGSSRQSYQQREANDNHRHTQYQRGSWNQEGGNDRRDHVESKQFESRGGHYSRMNTNQEDQHKNHSFLRPSWFTYNSNDPNAKPSQREWDYIKEWLDSGSGRRDDKTEQVPKLGTKVVVKHADYDDWDAPKTCTDSVTDSNTGELVVKKPNI